MAGKIRMGMVLFPLFVIFLMADAADAATAKDQPFVPRWWERSQVIRKLELTDDQVSRIRDLYRTRSKEITRAREALNTERARLKQLLVQDSPDDARVEQQIGSVGSALSALFTAEARMHHAMLKELNDSQRKALIPIVDRHRAQTRHKQSKNETEPERKRLERRYNRF